MHSGGFELTKLTYTMFEDHLIHHRGDRYYNTSSVRSRKKNVQNSSLQAWFDNLIVRALHEVTWDF